MALKEKQKQTSTRAWPDLPQQLIKLIARQSSLMQNIGFGGVTKSWRPTPRKCGQSPWPQLSCTSISDNGNGDEFSGNTQPHHFNISFYRDCFLLYGRRTGHRWPYPWAYFVGYSHNVLVARGPDPSQCQLRDPSSGCGGGLPPWDANIPFKFVALSNSSFIRPNCNCIVMVLTGASCPAFVFCRLAVGAKREWIKQDCSVIEPYAPNQQHMQFTNVIGFKGKFYALSLQGTLAIIEEVDSQLTITGLSRSRAVPAVVSRHFREYLVESDGEILLVFLISRKSTNIVDDVEVFRLHFPRLSWVKMESLGDRTLFAGGNSCMWVAASKVGCRRNCIYFTHQTQTVDGWWIYDMKSGGISPGHDSTTKSLPWDEPEANI